MKRIRLLSLWLSILVLGCDKTIDVSKYDPNPLTLKVVELPNHTYKMSWNALPASDFIDYQLIRAINDTIYNRLPNDTLFPTASLIARITDLNQTTFFDSVTIASSKVSFRLFAHYRDRLISSINVTLEGQPDISEIPNRGDQIFYSAQTNLLILLDKAADFITTLDVGRSDFLKSFQMTLSDATAMSFADDLGNPAIYVLDNFRRMHTINTLDFTVPVDIFANTRSTPFSVGGGGNLVYCAASESTTSISIRLFPNRNLSTEISSLILETPIRWLLFRVPNADELFAVEADSRVGRVMVFRNLSSSFLNDRVDYNSNRANLVDANRFEFAPNGSFLITGKEGTIYNRQMQLSKQLNINENYNSFYIDNNLTIYAATNRRIDIYNAPNYNLTRSVSCLSNPNKIFVIANQAYLFSPSVNQLNNTLFEKINL
jgi:hypothetical protein